MDDHYEDDYEYPCPYCGNPFTRWQDCTVFGCDDGYIDLYDEDPLWYDEGDFKVCTECRGTGIMMWCPNCGKDPRNHVPNPVDNL